MPSQDEFSAFIKQPRKFGELARRHNLFADKGCKVFMRKIKDDAVKCLSWMRDNQIVSARWVGPFGDATIAVGDHVTICAGAKVISKVGGIESVSVAKKAFGVCISDIEHGEVRSDFFAERGFIVVNPAISWEGSGGVKKQTVLDHMISINASDVSC